MSHLVIFFLFFSFSHANEETHGKQGPPVNGESVGWKAFSELQTGNMRFFEGRPQRPHQTLSRREALVQVQKPSAIVISCSDSRVPPEMIFDQGLGDVFSVRVAGNIVPPEAIASVEYALEHLGPRFLLVMGHESCGAVKAALGAKPGQSAGSPSLDHLVQKIRGNLSSRTLASVAVDPKVREPVKENVNATLMELVEKSAVLRKLVSSGELILAQGVYSLATGRVEFWDVGGKPQLSARRKTASIAAELTDPSEDEVIHGPAILEREVAEEPVETGARKPKSLPSSYHH